MKNDNAEVIWISSNVHVICEMGQVLKLWHPDFPQSINISLPWPTTPPFCKGTGQFRTGTGTVGLNGDTTVASSKTLTVATYTNVFWFQRIVAEVKLQREVVLEFLCELRMASFFGFFFKNLHFLHLFRAGKRWAIWMLKLYKGHSMRPSFRERGRYLLQGDALRRHSLTWEFQLKVGG